MGHFWGMIDSCNAAITEWPLHGIINSFMESLIDWLIDWLWNDHLSQWYSDSQEQYRRSVQTKEPNTQFLRLIKIVFIQTKALISITQLVHTLSKFRSLVHELYPTRSSLEHAIYGTSCLLPSILNLTTCHHSNLRLINWSYLSLLLAFQSPLSSLVGALCRQLWPFLKITHWILQLAIFHT